MIPQQLFFVASLGLVLGIAVFLRGAWSYTHTVRATSAGDQPHDRAFLIGLGGAMVATLSALALTLMINGRF
jgi:hypothetical protein